MSRCAISPTGLPHQPPHRPAGAAAGIAASLASILTTLVGTLLGIPRLPALDSAPVDSVARWQKLELSFRGPHSTARGAPNPFSILLDVHLRSPSGKRHRVPGFYDGDGHGNPDGDVWKARFSADENGNWTFTTRSAERRLDGHHGSFTVVDPPPTTAGFWKWGRLEYVGTAADRIRYLKFRDGPYWLKAGCDDPENFLGNAANFRTHEQRKAAVDYLAHRGINSLYIMTHNLDGDDKDVWPWLGDTADAAKTNGGRDARFDIPRLEEWRRLFEHMQQRGVVPYLVLEDDSAWSGYDHRRYYREIVARFGYLPALLFNIGEEHNENYSLRRALELARLLAELDPYEHPRGIHNVNRVTDEYIDAPEVHFTAIQTGNPSSRRPREERLKHNEIAARWIERCRHRNRRVLMVGFDEGRPEEERSAWWSAYLGGGVWEAHVLPPFDRPHSASEPVWTELGGARAFLESLPFQRMEPRNDLVQSGRAFCLARPDREYALYLPDGGRVSVRLGSGSYEYAWWNPRNGKTGSFQDRRRIRGGIQEVAAPTDEDWALRVVHAGNR